MIGQAPTSDCQASSSSDGDVRPGFGSGCRAESLRRKAPHSAVSSESTARRARTSSERLVSWVDSVVIAAGVAASRCAFAAWNSVGVTPNRSGAPPTSLSATKRFHR